MALPHLRLVRPLTETEWDTVGADIWRTPRPRVATTGLLGSGPQVLQIFLDRGSPSSAGPIPMVTNDPANLEVYAENPDGVRRQLSNWWPALGFTDDLALDPPYLRSTFYDLSTFPPYRANDAGRTTYIMGGAELLRISESYEDGPWTVELRLPWYWYAVDPALLLFILARFYSTGGPTTVTYLDKEAVLNFSAGVRSYLRRRRIQTWRTVGETLTDHIKRVVLEAGAMLRWGGYQAGSDTIQQWGLGVVDWEGVRNLSTVYNGDPDEDAGRDMFLTEQLVVRIADEFVLNKLRSRWGGGHRRINQGLTGGIVRYGAALEFPFQPIAPPPGYGWTPPDDGPPNLLEDEDAASVTFKGERLLERDLPNILDREGADVLLVDRWTSAPRVAEWAMGPLHWDFDVGDIVHVRHTGLGLDGTEDLVVIRKTIDWNTLHATIQALEVRQDPEPMDPTDTALGSRCEVWLKAELLIPTTTEVSIWVDSSGKLNHALPVSGEDSVGVTSPENGLAGWRVAEFRPFRGEIPRLEIPTLDKTWGSPAGVSRGWTIIAVAELTGTQDGPIVSGVGRSDGGTPDGYWELGVNAYSRAFPPESLPPGFDFWKWNTGDTELLRPEPFVEVTPITGRWHIITMVIDAGTYSDFFAPVNGSPLDIMDGAERYSDHPSPHRLPGSCHYSGAEFREVYVGGKSGTTASQSWDGKLAELQMFSTALRPAYIRRLHAGIRARYPGEGL